MYVKTRLNVATKKIAIRIIILTLIPLIPLFKEGSSSTGIASFNIEAQGRQEKRAHRQI